MHILQIVHQYLPENVGGTELYTHWLSQGLARRGHQVTIFYRRDTTTPGLKRREDDAGVSVWAVSSGRLSPTSRFVATLHETHIDAAFSRVLDKTRPDVAHVQHLQGLPVKLVDRLNRQNVPFIITLHDFWWICANAQLLTNYDQTLCAGPRAFLNCARCALARTGHSRLWPAQPMLAAPLAWRNHLLRRAMGQAARLVAPSDFVRGWYEAHGVSKERVALIPHGLEIPAPPSIDRRETGGVIRFAYLGGLAWQKGVHILLEAFRVLGATERAELWIIGDETSDPAYVSNLRELATSRVSFLGKQPRHAVWKLLSQVDVVVVPSLWYEAYAFVVSEAFAAGAPVVASRLGTLVDRVEHEVDGLLVPPGDVVALSEALGRLVREPDLLLRLRGGLRPVRTFDAHITDLEATYASVLSAP